MSAVSTIIVEPVIALFRRHKLKAVSIVVFAIGWAFLIFPYGDLADLASAQVSEATQGQVYLDMDSISLNIFPTLGATLEKITIETPMLPAVTLASLTAAPSIPSLLAFRLGGSASATGLFRGDVDISFAQGAKTKSGQRLNEVEATLRGISLDSVNDFVRASPLASAEGGDPMAGMRAQLVSNLNLRGLASGSIRASVDPGFADPPSGAFDVNVSKFFLDLSSLLGIQLTFEKSHIVGRLADGKVSLERADLGTAKDELSLKAKGTVDLAISRSGGGTSVVPGAYDLTVSLNASQLAVRRLGLVLDSIKAQGAKVETTSDGVASYRFRAVPGPGGLPRYLPVE